MNRRKLLKTAGLAAMGAAAMAPARVPAGECSSPDLSNEQFYTSGKFDESKAKEAVLAMCRGFGYPVFPGMAEQLWVSDYGTGQFARLGLAATLFANRHGDGGSYMMLDLFLLPNQMLPEHWHLEGDHGITKTEGWLVRWGTSYVVGEGDDNLKSFPRIKIPKCHCGGKATTPHVVEATPGMFVPLGRLGSRHWQYGGPQGAVVTEVANYHTNSAVRHTDPAINDHFLGT